MILSEHVQVKVVPFLESFQDELAKKLKAIDSSFTSKGLINSGVVIKEYEKNFWDIYKFDKKSKRHSF